MAQTRTVTAVAAVVFCTAVALAQAPKVLKVKIDVKPGDEPTMVERNRGGFLPVAIISTDQFDAVSLDVASIRIGPTGTEAEAARTTKSDVNEDKRTDLLVLVRVQDLNIKCGDTAIRMTAKTNDGVAVEGMEAVKVEGCLSR
jgi:hypothetical protein